jgi:hypothetical protein
MPQARHGEVFELTEQMASFRPSNPHWFLPLIGVDPLCQRKGYGNERSAGRRPQSTGSHALKRHQSRRSDVGMQGPARFCGFWFHGFRGNSGRITAFCRVRVL